MLFTIILRLSTDDYWKLHSFPTRRSSDLRSRRSTTQGRESREEREEREEVNVWFAAGRPRGRPAANQTFTSSLSSRSEEHTSELQSPDHLVCRLLLEKKKKKKIIRVIQGI